jgi:purine-binding chemotaxis protein CheW
MLLVRLDQEIFALPSRHVREVMRYREPTIVPGAPAVFLGVINQRGTILPVVQTRMVFGFGEAPLSRANRMVVVAHEEFEAALLVDAVIDLVSLSQEGIDPVPGVLEPSRARLLRGIARWDEQPVALLEVSEFMLALSEA